MDEKDFYKLLEQLHEEIEGAQNVSDESRTLLRELGKDIRTFLARTSGEREQTEASLQARLNESIANFETTHPTLTELLADLVTALSNAGI